MPAIDWRGGQRLPAEPQRPRPRAQDHRRHGSPATVARRIDRSETRHSPSYVDFAYLPFNNGMTFLAPNLRPSRLEVGATSAAEIAARKVLATAAVFPVGAALTLVRLGEAALALPLILAGVVAVLATALVFCRLFAQFVTEQSATDAAEGATSKHPPTPTPPRP